MQPHWRCLVERLPVCSTLLHTVELRTSCQHSSHPLIRAASLRRIVNALLQSRNFYHHTSLWITLYNAVILLEASPALPVASASAL